MAARRTVGCEVAALLTLTLLGAVTVAEPLGELPGGLGGMGGLPGGMGGGMGGLASLSLPELVQPQAQQQIDMASTLDCHRRLYTYKVQREDAAGRVCSGKVSVMSCWGRCDSNEISDWRFPYKRSFHPVCMHDGRRAVTMELTKCEEGVAPGTELYTYYEAIACRCAVCKSSEASCEGLRYRGQRSGPLGGR